MSDNAHTLKLSHGLAALWLILMVAACQPVGKHAQTPDLDPIYAQAFEALPRTEAGALISMAITQAGGWQAWIGKSSLHYLKSITYYDSAGVEQRQITQEHQYQLFPSFKARISWNEGPDQFLTLNNGQQAWRLKNGKVQTGESEVNSAYNSSYGSHYVMCMPFKLADPGSEWEYLGKDTLAQGQETLAIRVTYRKGAGSAAGMHIWTYFFDPATKRLVANFLDYGEGYTQTTYTRFQTVDGISLNQERLSYRSNARMDSLLLRTRYQNKQIRFGPALPDSLFTLSHE